MPARSILPLRPVQIDDESLALAADKVYTTAEACKRLKCCKATLYMLMDTGRIPFFQDRPRGRRKVPELGIRKYLAANVKHGESD